MQGYWNEDQTHAWVYWRDEDSIALVAQDGDFSFCSLRHHREWRDLIDSSARMEWRNIGGATGKTADGQPRWSKPPSKDVYARLSSPPPPRPQPVGEFEILRMNLYAACARGEIAACGRFHGGELEQIPAAEFAKGKRPEGWADIRYAFEDLRRAFPPVGCPGPSAAPGAKEPQNAAPAPVRTAAVSVTPIEANAPTTDKRADAELNRHEPETHEDSANNPPRPGRRPRKRKPKIGYESYLREWVRKYPVFAELRQAEEDAAERQSFARLLEIANEFKNHCKVDRPYAFNPIPDRIRSNSALAKILRQAISERAAAIAARKATAGH
jgi:hypothetical protein